MDVESAFIANGQAAHPCEPRQGALHDPAVTAQPLATLHASAGNARHNAALAASPAAAPVVIPLVGVELVRPLARLSRPAFDRHHSIEQFGQRYAVMHVRRRQDKRQRQALAVGQQVTLCARLTPVRGIRSCGRAPLFAGMDALSMQARLQSMRSAECRRCRSS